MTNTGKMDGKETAQLYVRPINAKVMRPYKELKGYEKKMIPAGATVNYEIELNDEAFAYYKPELKDFGVDSGSYEILIGPASDNTPLKKTVKF